MSRCQSIVSAAQDLQNKVSTIKLSVTVLLHKPSLSFPLSLFVEYQFVSASFYLLEVLITASLNEIP